MGPTGSGKSSVSRSLYFREVYNDVVKFQFIHDSVPPESAINIKIGHSVESETDQIEVVPVAIEGTMTKLVDTPGFDDSREGTTDAEVLNMIATFLANE